MKRKYIKRRFSGTADSFKRDKPNSSPVFAIWYQVNFLIGPQSHFAVHGFIALAARNNVVVKADGDIIHGNLLYY